MADFIHNTSLNNVDWDGTSDLTLSKQYIASITLTGDPRIAVGGPYKLVLPQTQATNPDDNFMYGMSIIIRDPNNYINTSAKALSVNANPADTSPIPTVNGQVQRADCFTETNNHTTRPC